jgi:hypothetical protein
MMIVPPRTIIANIHNADGRIVRSISILQLIYLSTRKMKARNEATASHAKPQNTVFVMCECAGSCPLHRNMMFATREQDQEHPLAGKFVACVLVQRLDDNDDSMRARACCCACESVCQLYTSHHSRRTRTLRPSSGQTNRSSRLSSSSCSCLMVACARAQ